MLDFLKKLFAAKPAQPVVTEAPYKIETPAAIQADGDVITTTSTVTVADAPAAWPFPDNTGAPARKPRQPRTAAEAPIVKPARKTPARKPAQPAAVEAKPIKKPAQPRKPRAPKAAS